MSLQLQIAIKSRVLAHFKNPFQGLISDTCALRRTTLTKTKCRYFQRNNCNNLQSSFSKHRNLELLFKMCTLAMVILRVHDLTRFFLHTLFHEISSLSCRSLALKGHLLVQCQLCPIFLLQLPCGRVLIFLHGCIDH